MGDKRSIANITKSDQKFALLAWPILVEMAESSKTTTYKALAQTIDEKHPKANTITGGEHHQVNRWMYCIHRMLGHIDKNIPPIGLLVKTTTGEFGQGLAKTLDDPNETLQDIYKYPWHKVHFQIFPKVVDSFVGKSALKKQKDKAQKAEKKRLKNSPKLAEDKLDAYLNSHDTNKHIKRFLLKHKKELIGLVKNGMDVSIAILTLFRKHMKSASKQIGSSGKGFVYLGEYVNKDDQSIRLTKHIKIGFSSNLDKRAKELVGGVNNPIRFNFLGYQECSSPFEAYILEQKAQAAQSHLRYENSEFFCYIDKELFLDDVLHFLKINAR